MKVSAVMLLAYALFKTKNTRFFCFKKYFVKELVEESGLTLRL